MMTDKSGRPVYTPETKEIETETPPTTGMTRREVLSKTVKATYIAPALTILSMLPVTGAAYSEPPPPLTGEDRRGRPPNLR